MVRVRAERKGDFWACAVIVVTDGRESRFDVKVHPADLDRWASGDDEAAVERLVARSFDFLLEREPASSILPSFDLATIQRYFPEYDREFKR